VPQPRLTAKPVDRGTSRHSRAACHEILGCQFDSIHSLGRGVRPLQPPRSELRTVAFALQGLGGGGKLDGAYFGGRFAGFAFGLNSLFPGLNATPPTSGWAVKAGEPGERRTLVGDSGVKIACSVTSAVRAW
jgi:hypothetical protein